MVFKSFECYSVKKKKSPLVPFFFLGFFFFTNIRAYKVFIALFYSLYITYNFPIVYSCKVIVGKKKNNGLMDWTKCRL